MRKLNLKTVLLITLLLLSIGLGLYYFFNYSNFAARPIQDVLNVNFEEMDKVNISTGSSSKQHIIENKEEIQNFLSTFKDVKIKKSMNQEASTGFSLNAILYKGDEIITSFSFGYTGVFANNIRYISNKNIDSNQIDEIEIKYNLKNN